MFLSVEQLQTVFNAHKFSRLIFDKTSDKKDVRGAEIANYIDQKKVDLGECLIIDDLSNGIVTRPRLFRRFVWIRDHQLFTPSHGSIGLGIVANTKAADQVLYVEKPVEEPAQ